ncbi:MAG: hypothetical protein ABIH72_00775 [archaeon]
MADSEEEIEIISPSPIGRQFEPYFPELFEQALRSVPAIPYSFVIKMAAYGIEPAHLFDKKEKRLADIARYCEECRENEVMKNSIQRLVYEDWSGNIRTPRTGTGSIVDIGDIMSEDERKATLEELARTRKIHVFEISSENQGDNSYINFRNSIWPQLDVEDYELYEGDLHIGSEKKAGHLSFRAGRGLSLRLDWNIDPVLGEKLIYWFNDLADSTRQPKLF